MIHIRIDNVTHAIALQHGNFKHTEFAVHLQAVLNDSFQDCQWVVLYVPKYMHYTIMCNKGFELINCMDTDYAPDSVLRKLGFGCRNFQSVFDIKVGQHSVTSTYASDLEDDDDQIIIHIDAMHVNNGITSVINKSFAVLYKKSYESNKRSIRKVFPIPISRLSKISLSFYDIDGNLYDFQNRDHIIEFIVESPKQPRRYTVYPSD
jgi:hypothetical protein